MKVKNKARVRVKIDGGNNNAIANNNYLFPRTTQPVQIALELGPVGAGAESNLSEIELVSHC